MTRCRCADRSRRQRIAVPRSFGTVSTPSTIPIVQRRRAWCRTTPDVVSRALESVACPPPTAEARPLHCSLHPDLQRAYRQRNATSAGADVPLDSNPRFTDGRRHRSTERRAGPSLAQAHRREDVGRCTYPGGSARITKGMDPAFELLVLESWGQCLNSPDVRDCRSSCPRCGEVLNAVIVRSQSRELLENDETTRS